MSLRDRVARILRLRRAPVEAPWVKEVVTRDARGRLEERLRVYRAHDAIDRTVERFDGSGRRVEGVTSYRDGTTLVRSFDERGDTVQDEWRRRDGSLEKRLTIAYEGGEAIVTTYDGEGREIARSRQPKRTV